MNNPNQNTLLVAKPLAEVKGMLTIQSKKTGATKIQLMTKRVFTANWLKEQESGQHRNLDGTLMAKKQAARDFDAYRTLTLDQFNAQVGQAFASGAIRAERISADKTGDLRTISLMRRDTKVQDQNMAKLRDTSELTGIPLDELIKRAKANAHAADIEVETVAAVEPAKNEEPAAPAESSAAGVPVEAAA